MAFKMIEQLDENHLPQIFELYQNEWWTKTRSKEDISSLLRNTTFVFGLIDESNDNLVGFTRVLSDLLFKAIIFDVIVKPDYRGHHLGAKLIQHVINHPQIRDIESIELYCLEGLRLFYEQFGFESVNAKFHFMRLKR